MTPKAAPSQSDPLEAKAAALLADYLRDGRSRTDLLKELADVIVQIRQSYQLSDGSLDLAGRTAPYRRAVARIYEAARLTHDHKVRDTVQSALRYHVGNRLREIYTEEEISAAGLSRISPKKRRDVDREALIALSGKLAEYRADPAAFAAHAEVLLEQVRPEDLVEVGELRARAARVSLVNILALSTELVGAVDDAFPPPAAAGRGRAARRR